MAKANNLYTVYHSLDNKGAFDPRPNATPNDDPDDIAGKYYQEPTEYPKFVHCKGLPSVIVQDKEQEELAKKDFAKKLEELKRQEEPDFERKQMEAQAKKLGIKFDGRTSDKKLAYLIEEVEENKSVA